MSIVQLFENDTNLCFLLMYSFMTAGYREFQFRTVPLDYTHTVSFIVVTACQKPVTLFQNTDAFEVS